VGRVRRSIRSRSSRAYLGVAAGVGEAAKALGALAVLGANVAMLVAAGTLTLVVQRWLAAGGHAARLRRFIRSES
jgi:hypothetical protein